MDNRESKLKIVDRDMLKYIAVIPMTIGHFIAYLADLGLIAETTWWQDLLTYCSLIAPPIFFFFVTEGFRYTHSKKQYALRLLVFALVTQIPFCLLNYETLLTSAFFTNWNVIATLFLGLVALMIWESGLKMPVRIVLIVLLDALTVVLSFEWMLLGIPAILGLHIFRDKPKARLIWYACIMMINSFIAGSLAFNWIFFECMLFFMLAYFLLTVCYNGKKGRHPVFAKWFFYTFYPLHLAVLYLIRIAV